MNLDEYWEGYAIKLARQYKRLPDETMHTLRFDSIHSSLNESYHSFVKLGTIPKMENLEEGYKQELWKKSREYSDDQQKRVLICRSIYLLETLTNES